MTRKTHLWDHLGGRLGDLQDPAALDRALATVAADPGARRLEPDPDALRAALATGPRTEARLFGLIHAQHAARQGRGRWGEQLGPIVDHTDALFAACPDARLLHLVRDPRDRYAASSHRGPAAIVRETDRWRRDARRAAANAAAYPGLATIVRHEDLAAGPVAVLEEVCAFVGLDPTDAMRASIAGAFPGPSPRRLGTASRAWIARAAAAEMRDLGYGRSEDTVPAVAGGNR
jgi:hypothetical protein